MPWQLSFHRLQLWTASLPEHSQHLAGSGEKHSFLLELALRAGSQSVKTDIICYCPAHGQAILHDGTDPVGKLMSCAARIKHLIICASLRLPHFLL